MTQRITLQVTRRRATHVERPSADDLAERDLREIVLAEYGRATVKAKFGGPDPGPWREYAAARGVEAL